MGGVNSGKIWDEDEDDKTFFDTKPSPYVTERTVQSVVNEVVKAHLTMSGGDFLDEIYDEKFGDVVMTHTAGMRMRAVRDVPFGFMTGIQFKGKDITEITADVTSGLQNWKTPEGKFSFDIYTRLQPLGTERDNNGDRTFIADDGTMTGISMILILRRPDPPKKRGRPKGEKDGAETSESADSVLGESSEKKAKT